MRFKAVKNGKPKQREQDLQTAIMQYLTLRGALVWRANAGDQFRGKYKIRGLPKGFPDLFGVLPDGRFFAIECKVDTKLTQEQADFLEKIIKNEGVAMVARSVADVENIL